MIDILFLITMGLAVFNGIRNGLIVAVFSILGWILGMIAAFRFADVVAEQLKDTITLGPGMLYMLSFSLVFILVILVVGIGAKLIRKTVELVLLGWVDKLGGIFFYVLLYSLIFSVMIYIAERLGLITEQAVSASKVYDYIRPLAIIIQKPFLQ